MEAKECRGLIGLAADGVCLDVSGAVVVFFMGKWLCRAMNGQLCCKKDNKRKLK